MKSRSLKSVKLCIGENRMYTLRDREGKVTTNMDRIVEVVEGFYGDPHGS